eukprot:1874126-Pleurochrysis_carterae.AAC.1
MGVDSTYSVQCNEGLRRPKVRLSSCGVGGKSVAWQIDIAELTCASLPSTTAYRRTCAHTKRREEGT